MEDSSIRNNYINKFQTRNIEELTPIQNFYKDTVIFITGSTGFLGQLVLEKLLRSCPDISTIYILVRNKKGKDVQSRVDQIFDNAVFDILKKSNPKFKHKVIAVAGDCALPNLGLSEQDTKILMEEVSIRLYVLKSIMKNELSQNGGIKYNPENLRGSSNHFIL